MRKMTFEEYVESVAGVPHYMDMTLEQIREEYEARNDTWPSAMLLKED